MVRDLTCAVVRDVADCDRWVTGGEGGAVETVVADAHADYDAEIGEELEVFGCEAHFEREDAVCSLAEGFGDVGPGFGVLDAGGPERGLDVFEGVFLGGVGFEKVLFEDVVLEGLVLALGDWGGEERVRGRDRRPG